jgi:phage terminase small subunit
MAENDPYEEHWFLDPEHAPPTNEPEAQLTMAMRVLTPKQRAFVRAMAIQTRNGKPNYTEAARQAGYSGGDKSLSVMGSRLAHDPKIKLAMQEEARGMLYDGAQVAVSALLRIIHDTATSTKDRIKASAMILNRVGLNEVTQHEVSVTRVQTEAEKIQRAVRLAKELGIEPKLLLGRAGINVDEDGKVLPPPKPEPEPVWNAEWGEPGPHPKTPFTEMELPDIVDAEFVDVTGESDGLEDLL